MREVPEWVARCTGVCIVLALPVGRGPNKRMQATIPHHDFTCAERLCGAGSRLILSVRPLPPL